MRALIIGIDGEIGAALKSYLEACGWDVFGTSRRVKGNLAQLLYVDLSDENTFKNITENYDVIYACAALVNLKYCEENPNSSKLINYTAQVKLANHCLDKTAHYIFLSSSAVFDGTLIKPKPHDIPNPKCIYGKHKRLTEEYLLQFPNKVSIIRPTKIIGRQNTLLTNWQIALQNGEKIEPFHDMTLSPVPMDLLLELLKLVGEHQACSIVHLSGEKDVKYSDLASMMARILNVPMTLVKPKSYMNAGINANTIFSSSSLNMDETSSKFHLKAPNCNEILSFIPHHSPT